MGTVFQWWLTRHVALQGTALAGLGLGAAGTVGDRAERDYHYGLTPLTLLGARLIFGDRAMVEATGRQYYVAGTSSNRETGVDTSHFSQDVILRGSVGLTVRLFGPHALGHPVSGLEPQHRRPRPARPAPVGADRDDLLQLPRPHALRRGGVAPRRGVKRVQLRRSWAVASSIGKKHSMRSSWVFR